MSGRPALCRLCRGPALSTGVQMSRLDAWKLAKWWPQLLQTEFEEDNLEEHFVCQFCLWDAKLEGDSSGRVDCDWWSGNVEKQFYEKFYHLEPIIRPSEVRILQQKSGILALKALYKIETRCNFCGDKFESKLEATLHIKSVHKHEKKYPCAPCVLYFKNENQRKMHTENVHGGGFGCLYCPVSFSLSEHLRIHVKKMHTGQVIKCEICTWSFATNAEKDAHIEERHIGLTFKSCIYCKQYISGSHLLAHMNRRHKSEAIRCPYNKCVRYFLSDSERDEHLLEMHPKKSDRFQCIFCKVHLYESWSLVAHLRKKHKSETYFKCSFHSRCHRYFHTQDEEEQHYKLDHKLGQESFECIYCNRSYTSLKNLNGHVNTSHKKEKIVCKILVCRQLFLSRQDLQKHCAEKHQNDKRPKIFECSLCAFKTHKEIFLSRHVLVMHGSSKIKCPKCPKFFKSQFSLDGHMRLCTRVKKSCPQCNVMVKNLHGHLRGDFCITCKKFICRRLSDDHLNTCS